MTEEQLRLLKAIARYIAPNADEVNWHNYPMVDVFLALQAVETEETNQP